MHAKSGRGAKEAKSGGGAELALTSSMLSDVSFYTNSVFVILYSTEKLRLP